jgi:hypothetical protein
MQTRYEHVKSRYRNAVVATTCDSSRFLSAKGQKRNRLMLAAIQRAFDKAACLGTPIHGCLDLPCGTGRLFPWLAQLQFVGADISLSTYPESCASGFCRRWHGSAVGGSSWTSVTVTTCAGASDGAATG